MTIQYWYNNHKDNITDLNFSYNICEIKDYIANYNYFSSPKRLKSGNFAMLNGIGDCNILRVRFDTSKGKYINIHFIISPEEIKKKLAKQTYISLEKWVLFNKPFLVPETKIYINIREIYSGRGKYFNRFDVPIILNLNSDYSPYASYEVIRMSIIHGSEGEGIYLYLLAK